MAGANGGGGGWDMRELLYPIIFLVGLTYKRVRPSESAGTATTLLTILKSSMRAPGVGLTRQLRRNWRAWD